jgi:hypothetical protein
MPRAISSSFSIAKIDSHGAPCSSTSAWSYSKFFAQKIVRPWLSITIDEPSNSSSSLPPTWFT